MAALPSKERVREVECRSKDEVITVGRNFLRFKVLQHCKTKNMSLMKHITIQWLVRTVKEVLLHGSSSPHNQSNEDD